MTDPATQRRRIVRFYRWLDRLAWMTTTRAQSGNQAQPVHRALRDPDGGPPSTETIHRLLLRDLPLPPTPRVLDAGCGYGATALALQPQTGGTWHGITISPIQVQRATAEAAARGLSNAVTFAEQSYDDPLPGPFDLAIAIESLIHSTDPAASIANIAASLAPGGWLVIVDDMPEPALTPRDQADLATFQRMWRCPVAPPAPAWRAALAAAGLTLAHESDLTPLVLNRPEAELAAPLARQRRRAAWLAPFGLALREQADIGGMTLELLQGRGAMRYRLLAARRPLGVR